MYKVKIGISTRYFVSLDKAREFCKAMGLSTRVIKPVR